MIWLRNYTLDEVNQRGQNTMVSHLGIEMTAIGDNYLEGRMPVDERTRQPLGLLHGGASLALAESLASTAASMVVDLSKEYCVGLEINGNHISSCTEGYVMGRATPIHMGKRTQVWEIRITQDDRLVCISRMTAVVIPRGSAHPGAKGLKSAVSG